MARSGLGALGPEGGAGFLEAGDWQVTTSYRHQYSFKHFIGPTEQVQRIQLGNEVMSKANLENLNVTYQATDRVSIQANLPVLFASRRSNNGFATLHTSGIGDSSVVAQCWVWNPKTTSSGNVEIGLGLQMPTGKDRVQNSVVVTPGGPAVLNTPDYSVQPGQGAWGMVMQWQAFKDVGNQVTLFTDGSYLMTQGGNNGVISQHGGASATFPAANVALTQFNAIQDLYVVEALAAHPAPKIKGLAFTLGLRDEGVPARNLIGNDLGFRRPGFAISLEPGFIFTRGLSMIQANVGIAMYRDRTLSVPDQILGTHGDAAFADYVWMLNYTLRLPKRHSVDEESLSRANTPPDAKAPANASFKAFNLKSLDGSNKTLQDFANKVTVVSFFFPKCPYCNIDLPEEQKIYDKYKDKGLSMVWINILPEQEKLVAPWLDEHHFNVPVLLGKSLDSLAKDYRVKATPTNYLLGEKGEVIYYQTGYKPGDEKSLEAKIAAALNVAP